MNSDEQLDLQAVRETALLRDVVFYPELDSTNAKAVQLAREGCDTPTLVIAETQSAGRGRGNKTWWSPHGALTFSLILDFPMLPVAKLQSFSLTAGLSVCQALERFVPHADLALKWPNDVYLNEKKIAGILIENPVAGEPRLVVGIGVNVNNRSEQAPKDLEGVVISLRDVLQTSVSQTALLIECLRQLERRAKDQIHHPSALLDQWRAYCMLTGKQVVVESNGTAARGICRGIDADAALLVDDGAVCHRIIAGVVVRWETTRSSRPDTCERGDVFPNGK